MQRVAGLVCRRFGFRAKQKPSLPVRLLLLHPSLQIDFGSFGAYDRGFWIYGSQKMESLRKTENLNNHGVILIFGS